MSDNLLMLILCLCFGDSLFPPPLFDPVTYQLGKRSSYLRDYLPHKVGTEIQLASLNGCVLTCWKGLGNGKGSTLLQLFFMVIEFSY